MECLDKFIAKYGKPSLVQSDNGTKFTNKYVSENNPKRKERPLGGFEFELKKLKVDHYLIRLGTPELNKKVERFNQTIKRELASRLFREHGIEFSHSTICSVLKRYKISKKYRTVDYH